MSLCFAALAAFWLGWCSNALIELGAAGGVYCWNEPLLCAKYLTNCTMRISHSGATRMRTEYVAARAPDMDEASICRTSPSTAG